MLKNLIEKRTALLAEYDAMKGKLEIEKRSAYTNEEREAINKIKIDIEEIDNSIALEKDIEAKRNAKLDILSVTAPNTVTSTTSDKNLVTEFRSFLNGGRSG